jgi:hypothetical protein
MSKKNSNIFLIISFTILIILTSITVVCSYLLFTSGSAWEWNPLFGGLINSNPLWVLPVGFSIIGLAIIVTLVVPRIGLEKKNYWKLQVPMMLFFIAAKTFDAYMNLIYFI